ncbi:MAG: transcriptional regulator, MerR family [Herbinix sp.]|jgi:DNA-binding transcriptional MerR regulator|nr:transcriptional regulator, MerR family [Herbinix sp.]
MYTLDLFSKMSGVPAETIHRYEIAGLLQPAETNNITGEKLYTSTELITLHIITAFSQMGFIPEEIVSLLTGTEPEVNLQNKQKQLIWKIKRLNQKITDVDDYLLEAEECNVVIKSLPEIIVASKEVIISSLYELIPLADAFRDKLKNLGCEITAAENHYIVYHEDKYEDKDFTVQLCITVDEIKVDTKEVRFRTIPAVPKAACSYHRGSYDTMHLTHDYSALWMDYHHYLIEGDFRQVFIDGAWNKRSESEWLTEVQVPIN